MSESDDDKQLWNRIVAKFDEKIHAEMEFKRKCKRPVEIVGRAITSSGSMSERMVAYSMATVLKPEERLQLFPILVSAAAHTHSLVTNARKLILTLPREWVIENIEPHAEKAISQAEAEGFPEDAFRRLLELYFDLDRALTEKLARKAILHKHPEVKEAGEDFLEALKK